MTKHLQPQSSLPSSPPLLPLKQTNKQTNIHSLRGVHLWCSGLGSGVVIAVAWV